MIDPLMYDRNPPENRILEIDSMLLCLVLCTFGSGGETLPCREATEEFESSVSRKRRENPIARKGIDDEGTGNNR